MKRILIIALSLLLGFLMASAAWYYSKIDRNKPTSHNAPMRAPKVKLKRALATHAQELRSYAAAHKYNTRICFLIDMNEAAGKNRFFVYDLTKDSVLDAGLVTHGRCNKNWLTGRQYGNAVGCGCTSLGKYKIGKPYQGKFGLAYKLYGLDSTNNNAFKRFVVLHSHSCVPNAEVDPYPICQSDGCPTVSPGYLKKLADVINASANPILLYTFDSN